MPTPSRLPPADTLIRMRDKHTLQEIADKYGVTKQSVYDAIRKAHPDHGGKRPRYGEMIPWTVKEEHARTTVAQMLRLLGRAQQGEQLKEDEANRIERFTDMLARHGLVIDYDPDEPPTPASPIHGGWKYVKRRATDNGDFIRRPTKQRKAGADSSVAA